MVHEGKSSGVMMRGVVPDENGASRTLADHLESGRLADLVREATG